MEEYPPEQYGERRRRRDCIGTWQARYRDAGGKQRAKNFTRKRDAEAFLDDARSKVRTGTYIDPARQKVTVREWYEKWEEAQGGAPSTVARRKWAWTTHVEPKWGDWSLGDIGYLDVETWVKEMGRRVGHASQKKNLELLRRMLDAAMKDRRIPFNPASGVKLPPPPPRHPDDLEPPTPEQCETIRQLLPEHYQGMVIFLQKTGLRWGEMAGLRRCHVDLDGAVVKVREVVVEVNSRLYRQAQPKSAAGFRTVPLLPEALDALERRLAEWPADPKRSSVEDGMCEEELVWRGPRGGVMARNNFHRVWIAALKETDFARQVKDPVTGRIEWWPRVHDLRHRFASDLHAAGVPEKVVQSVMGHERGGRVTWLYTHAGEDPAEQVRAALTAARSGEGPAEGGRHLRAV
ncbi:MAG TPA: site-specific integrase [Streptomyces sp.]|nr:site-specific integrase [Streptomyces sp.]